jgi:pilus assembly protein CpaC
MADSVAQPSVIAVRHWSEGDVTRVAIDVSGDFQFRSERLHHPERIYFDIPGARSQLENGRPFSEETHDRFLMQIRVAAYSPGVTRVVLQLADGVETAASKSVNPSRLDISLRAAGPPAEADAQPREAAAARPPEKAAETVPEMAPETAKVEAPVAETIGLTAISLPDAASPAPVDAQSREAPAARPPEKAGERAPDMAPETDKVEPPVPETIELAPIRLRDAAASVPVDAQPREAPAARPPAKPTGTATEMAPETVRVAPPIPGNIELTLITGRGDIIECPDGVVRISTSSPEVVDAAAASDTEVLFHAKALGQATLVVWSRSGHRRIYQVTVEPNLEPMRQLLRETFPDDQIDLRATRDSLALVGHAHSQAVADRALALVSASVKGSVNNLQVAPAPTEPQILLKVRFAEVNRSATTELGINLLSTGAAGTVGSTATGQFSPPTSQSGGIPAAGSGGFKLTDLLNIFAFRPDLNLGLLIHDLENKGLLEILAEPNLVATNGKEAHFLAGGEFPVPVVEAGASAGAITVQFRQYGIRLSFTPHVTARRTIQLHVRPEVSTIDPANGVIVSGFNIPALSTRSVETDIELGEGQSFAIAGLLDERVTQTLERMPGLANIPILGTLFRSRSVDKTKTELVVVVTPQIAAPVNGAVPLPPPPVPYFDVSKEPRK